jgi:hypothetical protein
MAQGKKSFVLYTDLIHVVRKLPKDVRGDLFLIILEYVNDNLDIVQAMEEVDMLLSVTFEPVKQQLKRDLRKYEEKQLQRSLAGKRSAELRTVQQNERNSTTVDGRQQTSTDNVNDSVNDNVNDSDDNKLSGEIPQRFICEVEKIKDFMESGENAYWFEVYCMQNKIPPEQLRERISQFVAELKNQNIKEKSTRDVFSHFHNWNKKNQLTISNTENNGGKKTVFQA